MAKILVTGGSGKIGKRFVERVGEIVSPSDEVYFLKRDSEIENIDPIVRHCAKTITTPEDSTYDFAFHLAANTHTKNSDDPRYRDEFIEDNITLTQRVCNQSGRVLILSTDNVFSGENEQYQKEFDELSPCNFYGQTKLDAERIVLNEGGAVIRIQTMIGVKNNLIIHRVLEALDGKEYWPFWDDTFSRPSFFEDFFKVARRMYETDKNSIYHVSCEGEPLSRADIAYKVLEVHKRYHLQTQREEFAIEHCNVKFPHYLVLDTKKTKRELNLEFTSIDKALEAHVHCVKGID